MQIKPPRWIPIKGKSLLTSNISSRQETEPGFEEELREARESALFTNKSRSHTLTGYLWMHTRVSTLDPRACVRAGESSPVDNSRERLYITEKHILLSSILYKKMSIFPRRKLSRHNYIFSESEKTLIPFTLHIWTGLSDKKTQKIWYWVTLKSELRSLMNAHIFFLFTA